MSERLLPRYPVYVPSKGRSDQCLTAQLLIEDEVPFHIVVEPQEADDYACAFSRDQLLVLPHENYGDGCSVPVRNWIKDHATAAGHLRHWQFDDNIRHTRRRWQGKRIPCRTGIAQAVLEDFVDRYENIAIAGLSYAMFNVSPDWLPAFRLNVHVYSCLLVLNAIPHRWRLRYNDDTDLCLQVLSDGWCTVLFNAFMVDKMRTMTMKGGNTPMYQDDGRLKMARMLERAWPGVVKVTRKYSKPQHSVNWQKFDTPLKRRADVDFDALPSIDEYGMKLREIEEPGAQADVVLATGGGVPGGHYVLQRPGKPPFITGPRGQTSFELRHSDVVVDIGAYVGTYAIRCARFPVQRAVAYEPTPRSFEAMARTNAPPNLERIQAAVVADDRESIELFVSSGIGVANNIMRQKKGGSAGITVPAVRYEEAVRGASVVKIDVEGVEYDYPIVQPGIRALLIDFHPEGKDWVDRAEEIISTLEAAGFECVLPPDFSKASTMSRHGLWSGCWIRNVETTGVYKPLMKGDLCCGCGTPIQAETKALCQACFESWSKKHRKGFALAEMKGVSDA